MNNPLTPEMRERLEKLHEWLLTSWNQPQEEFTQWAADIRSLLGETKQGER